MSSEGSTASQQRSDKKVFEKRKTEKEQIQNKKDPETNKKVVVENSNAIEFKVPVSEDSTTKKVRSTKPVADSSSTSRRRGDKNAKPDANKKITDYYQIRRSSRCTEAELKKQKQNDLEEHIRNGSQHGLEVRDFPDKGRGVVATRQFARGEFVVEYAGELIDLTSAKEREQKYANEEKGCYIYYFTHKDKNYCIDATSESGLFGRLVNHSCKNFNCTTKPIEVDGKPRLILVASRLVNAGEELLYDYGDRNSESLKAHPWLAY